MNWHHFGIKGFTSWDPILCADNFACEDGSQIRQKAQNCDNFVQNIWFKEISYYVG